MDTDHDGEHLEEALGLAQEALEALGAELLGELLGGEAPRLVP